MARININAIRRRQIIDAALDVMARKGWSETSIDEITREAGVSRGLVSYHFKDKADVLAGVLERCRESYQEAVRQAGLTSNDRRERMRLGIRRAIELIREDPINYEVLLLFAANARSHPELGEQIRALWADFDRNTANAIRAGQTLGLYRRDIDPEAAAVIINGTIAGLALRWRIDPGGYPFDETAKEAESMLMAFLTPEADVAAPDEPRVAQSDGRSPTFTHRD
jgi:TetR/AcrR family fatty acid metabolism transcriptional regulator